MRVIYVLAALGVTLPAMGQIQVELWNSPWNHHNTAGESVVDPSRYLEIADDFEITGRIFRVVAWGMDDGCSFCPLPVTEGVFVRFYEWTASGPGTLLSEIHLEEGDPRFLHAVEPARVEVILPEPFAADGRYFISVQIEFAEAENIWPGRWSWWISNRNAPRLLPVHSRNSATGEWQTPSDFYGLINGDVAFQLFGTSNTPTPADFDPCGEWVVTATPNPPNATQAVLTDVGVVTPDNVWAVGAVVVPQSPGSASGIRLTYVLHWDGETWTEVPSPSPTECPQCTWAGLTSIGVVDADDIWAAGNARVRVGDPTLGSHAMIQHWDGTSWEVAAIFGFGGGSGGSIADIEVVSPDNVWFVGGRPPPGAQPVPALSVRWNGSSFDIVDVPIVNFEIGRDGGNPLNAIDALRPDDMWAVGETSVTADEGPYSQIHHFDGQEWTHVPGPTPGYYNILRAVEMIAPDDVWAGGEYWDVDGIFGFLIHWDGTSWTQMDAPGIIFDFHAFGPNEIYAAGGAVWRYDGSTWNVVETFPQLSYPSLSRFDDVGPCDLWLAGRTYIGGGQKTLMAHLIPGLLHGDMNCDGNISISDIGGFVMAMTDPEGYQIAHGDCELANADANANNEVSLSDIGRFVEVLLAE